jgi:hypothetical protein
MFTAPTRQMCKSDLCKRSKPAVFDEHEASGPRAVFINRFPAVAKGAVATKH